MQSTLLPSFSNILACRSLVHEWNFRDICLFAHSIYPAVLCYYQFWKFYTINEFYNYIQKTVIHYIQNNQIFKYFFEINFKEMQAI
jgi:hypothetical protein